MPVSLGPEKLLVLLRALLKQRREQDGDDDDDDDDHEAILERQYLFYVGEEEVKNTIKECFKRVLVNKERTLPVIYKPQAMFRVRPVTRCTSSMPGHTKPVVVTLFSPDGRYLASGAGDNTVRFWDINTETPRHECRAHRQYVLALAWAPDGRRLASGDKAGVVIVWDPETGKQCGRALTGHKQWITAVSWQPLHLAKEGVCRKLCSASKDGDVRIWDALTSDCLMSLTSHTMSVTCLRWGGTDLIYTASQDRTIKVWRSSDGALCRTLQGHGHWVNVLALNTDYVTRTAAFEPQEAKLVHGEGDPRSEAEGRERAAKR